MYVFAANFLRSPRQIRLTVTRNIEFQHRKPLLNAVTPNVYNTLKKNYLVL